MSLLTHLQDLKEIIAEHKISDKTLKLDPPYYHGLQSPDKAGLSSLFGTASDRINESGALQTYYYWAKSEHITRFDPSYPTSILVFPNGQVELGYVDGDVVKSHQTFKQAIKKANRLVKPNSSNA